MGRGAGEHLQGSNGIFAVLKKGRALVFSTALAQLQATNQNRERHFREEEKVAVRHPRLPSRCGLSVLPPVFHKGLREQMKPGGAAATAA